MVRLWQLLLIITCAEQNGACGGSCDDDTVLLYQLRVQDDPAPVIAQSNRGQEGEFDGMRYSAQKFTLDSVNITFTLAAGKTVDITVNCSDFSVFIDGHGSTLNRVDKNRFQTLVARLPEASDPVFPKIKDAPTNKLQKADSCDAAAALRQSTIFMSEGPTNYRIHTKRASKDILCLVTTQPCEAKWSDKNGRHKCKLVVGAKLKSKTLLDGDYGCMGRCGAGCKPASRKQIYTQGCMDHDMCSWQNRAHGGPLDSNCGDEWMAASDDFMFGDFCAFENDPTTFTPPMKEIEIPDEKLHIEKDNSVVAESKSK